MNLLSYSLWPSMLVTSRSIECWNILYQSYPRKNIYYSHQLYQNEYVNIYVNGPDDCSLICQCLWLTLRVTLSNWVGSIIYLWSLFGLLLWYVEMFSRIVLCDWTFEYFLVEPKCLKYVRRILIVESDYSWVSIISVLGVW